MKEFGRDIAITLLLAVAVFGFPTLHILGLWQVSDMKEPSYEPSREWDRHCEEEERWLAKRQVCDGCGEPIAEDYCYFAEGEYLCEDCMNERYIVETPVEE